MRADHSLLPKLLSRETGIVLFIWVVLVISVLVGPGESEFITSWTITIPAGWVLYHISLRWLFPRAITFRFAFLFYAVVVLIYCIAVFVLTLITLVNNASDPDFYVDAGSITFFTLLGLQAPVQWFVFKRLARNAEEVQVLKKELGHSEATADLLRSQINPHFLFNAFNTLYGLALQEKAERTSEAIEKLGSMMRFMLKENAQEKIPLARDVSYIESYLVLQQLRTQLQPGIIMQITLPQTIDPTIQIAPMLLIPFIENAFKHGISMRERSEIKIVLEVNKNVLNLEVFNTKHERSEHDPERNNTGIGLKNVQQRLQLLYPEEHNLTIREGANDYFIQLRITLAP